MIKFGALPSLLTHSFVRKGDILLCREDNLRSEFRRFHHRQITYNINISAISYLFDACTLCIYPIINSRAKIKAAPKKSHISLISKTLHIHSKKNLKKSTKIFAWYRRISYFCIVIIIVIITKLISMEANETLDYLTLHGIKPSLQRMAVMEYLLDHRTHPTADEIYSALQPTMPTLSKTTVYNTLKILTDKGAALQLTIDERNCCFDADTSPHAHFLCTECGRVFDLKLLNKRLEKCAMLPKNFSIDQAQLYFRGICSECQNQ